jgi:hypothetical protein
MRKGLQGAVTLVLVLLFAAWCAPLAGASGSPGPPITTRVILTTHRVVAGHPIKGTVVLTNTTRKQITVNTCALDGWLRVGLHGKVDSYPFGSFAVGCAPTVRLAPGANRFPVTVITTYASCTQPEPGGSPLTNQQPCTESNGHMSQPPLPAGRYSTKVSLAGLSRLTRPPNRVVVTLRAPAEPPVLPPCTETPSTAPNLVTVPNVVGDSSSGAALVFSKACLNAGYANPVGTRVMSESPPANTKVPEYSTVTLVTR